MKKVIGWAVIGLASVWLLYLFVYVVVPIVAYYGSLNLVNVMLLSSPAIVVAFLSWKFLIKVGVGSD